MAALNLSEWICSNVYSARSSITSTRSEHAIHNLLQLGLLRPLFLQLFVLGKQPVSTDRTTKLALWQYFEGFAQVGRELHGGGASAVIPHC